MFLIYFGICIVIVLLMLCLEWVMRLGEIRERAVFFPSEIRWRQCVAIILGILIFVALLLYKVISGNDLWNFLGV